MRILGIETSCDETSVAVIDFSRSKFAVRTNVVYSQVALHAKTGGVVPEVAAREHCVKILPVLTKALRDGTTTRSSVDALAVTAGPGLITSLIVGVEAARTLAYAWDKPLIPVNHIEAHVASNWLTNEQIRFPAMCLVVSGGHTELHLMKNRDSYRCVGRTMDDAAGEAFDKVAKTLKLGYPGGPLVSKIAHRGKADAYNFPRPMMRAKNFNFSFAGLKTAVLYAVEGVPGKKRPRVKQADVAASFQQAVIDVLTHKTVAAAQHYRCASVLLAGGVAANTELRQQLAERVREQLPRATYHQPALEYCTDNAAMIGARGAFAFARKKRWPWQKVQANPNWEVW